MNHKPNELLAPVWIAGKKPNTVGVLFPCAKPQPKTHSLFSTFHQNSNSVAILTKMVGVKKSKTQNSDVNSIQSDIASFASSLGFSSSAPSSGFNDSDFRKTGSFKSPKPQSKPNSHPKQHESNRKSKHVPVPQNRIKLLDIEENDYKKFNNLPKLPLIKSSVLAVWYKDSAELEHKLIGNDKKIVRNSDGEWYALVEKKKELGERLLAQYLQEYLSSRGQSGDIKMLIATQRSGTAADKVSALSVMVGDNAVANLRSIDSLLGLVTTKVGKRHAFTAFEALKEMFISLLPDHKLKTLSQRPLNHLSDTKDGNSLLLLWHWEECLKERYDRFISALEEASLDTLFKLKSMALKIMYILLSSKSEQERRLLTSLVNKLGDPEKKGASDAKYHLENLLSEHPNMKEVVIDEVDNFLFRPHLGMRAKYYAVNFLTQIRLSHRGDGPRAAKRLVEIYFALFKLLISEDGSSTKQERKISKVDKDKVSSESHVGMDSRLLSALLTGVNRAFPYVSSDEADGIIDVQTPLLFQLVHSKNFNIAVQALMLLDKISSRNQIVSDRFYRALYAKLLLPAAMVSSKEEMFIALLLRAMKNDIHIKRVAAFSKRLLQVSLQLPPQNACGCLFLLSEVLKARPPLWNLVHQNETASADDDLEHFEDVLDDEDDKPADKSNDEPQAIDNNNESDDEINSGGSESDEEGGDDLFGEAPGSDKVVLEVVKSSSDNYQQVQKNHKLPGGYNPRHREPTYCNADGVGWWELTVLASHVHPSVAAMANTLLSGVNIIYNGNPLTDLTLGAFLDKFMEKKPRQTTWRATSEIEPAKKLDMNHQFLGAEILSLAEADVLPEDVVFHKFYLNKMNSSSSKKSKKKKNKKTDEEEAAEELYGDDDGGEDDDDQSDDEEIENMLDTFDASSLGADKEYDYDDLDNIANEDDEDLIGNASDDEEIEFPSQIDDIDEDVEISSGGDDDSGEDDDIVIGEADDGSDFDDESFLAVDNPKDQKKRKSRSNSGASPFANIEDYNHLMDAPSKSSKKKKGPITKKKKMT